VLHGRSNQWQHLDDAALTDNWYSIDILTFDGTTWSEVIHPDNV